MHLSDRTRADLAKAERRRMIEAEGRERHAVERREVGEGVAETVGLGLARGEAFEVPRVGRGERDKPIRRLTGIEMLVNAGKLSGGRLKAAHRYRDAYQSAAAEPSLRSCLSDQVRGGEGPSIAKIGAAGLARMMAGQRLAAMRATLGHSSVLVTPCDLVLGQDMTPREAASGGTQAAVYTALLIAALDILAGADVEASKRAA